MSTEGAVEQAETTEREGHEPSVASAEPVIEAPPVTNLESFLAVDDALDPEDYRTQEAEGEGSGELPSPESDLDAML